VSTVIRLANRIDAPLWIKLLRATIGSDYPAKEVYDLGWVAGQLGAGHECETYVAEAGGDFQASISFLEAIASTRNPVANLGRCFFSPESYETGAAEMLIQHVRAVVAERKQLAVARVPITDTPLQSLLERNGFACVGFQPVKHLHPVREGILFYLHGERPALIARLPISHSLAHVGELSGKVLKRLGIELPLRVEDGATGYPLQSLDELIETNLEQFEAHCRDTAARQVPPEMSTGSHRGCGVLRVTPPATRALLAQRGAETTAGVLWLHDEHDRCVRIADAFSTDEFSLGALLFRVVSLAQTRLSAAYVEMDVLATAPRLLKTAEQLGFVPIAYFPGLFEQMGRHIDVIKLVKLNVPHPPEPPPAGAEAARIVQAVERSFEDQRAGVSVVNLLRGLAMFSGLGDGELRKVAVLFQQKLVRPGETIFVQGGSGDEAFIVLRGQVEITLDDPPRAVAVIEPGQIFGEQAFLDGSLRTATASVNIPTILLVIQRTAFHELAQREPHLGLVVMRNIAVELSAKLRKTTVVWVADRKV
jgi:CRP/FNR family transcriptional regulator, cyclic AMP receptor protein